MPNRLIHSQSLYLRKHAENPIDWWPWGEAALQAAREQDKPIFLSVGYSSCHWCTVMEGEAFSDPAIAEFMNANFIPIKVDREERPDLDSVYMQALQMMTGQGGWPLNIFLAPDDLVPFYGGTYFPLEPKFGRPGFLQVLQALRQFYDSEKAKLNAVKGEILTNLQQNTLLPAMETVAVSLLEAGLLTSIQILAPTGYGTSFPMMPYAIAALRGVRFATADRDEMDNAAELCRQRGLDLVLGGIYDHVGGGFHRYTVDPTWTVPHFEKMLYDNGQIMEYLADLWRNGQRSPALVRAIAGTVQWLRREMTAPEGYFYAAQDADSFARPEDREPEEGEFYVWHYEELRYLLSTEELKALEGAFTLTPAGNFEGRNVLQRRHAHPFDETTEMALTKLFSQRYGAPPTEWPHFPPATDNQTARTQAWPGRIPPVTDTKMIVAWNSLMISGLAGAAVALHRVDYLTMATRAAQFIWQFQWVQERLHRVNYAGEVAVLAQAEDYALLIKALLDLQQATLALPEMPDAFDWLGAAMEVQAEFDRWLWQSSGGYASTARDISTDLLVQERPYQDSALPSANGIAIANLVRLSLLTEDLVYLDRAEQGLRAFGVVMEQLPRACPSLFVALDWFCHGTLVRTTADHLPGLMAIYRPNVIFAVDEALPAGAVGLVCRGLSCLEPAQSLDQLQQQILSGITAPLPGNAP